MRRKPRQTPEIPLASTADVAFLLLIFFLVAASSGTDRGLPLDLPSTEKSAEMKEVQNLEITIKADVIKIGDTELTDLADVLATLRSNLEGRTTPEEKVVLISADDEIQYQRWTDVVSAVEQAGGIAAPQIEEETSSSEE